MQVARYSQCGQVSVLFSVQTCWDQTWQPHCDESPLESCAQLCFYLEIKICGFRKRNMLELFLDEQHPGQRLVTVCHHGEVARFG